MNHFRPAPGYRYYVTGVLSYVGLGGYGWSSAVVADGYSAHHLYFNAQGLGCNSTTYRANGLQVRCLQE